MRHDDILHGNRPKHEMGATVSMTWPQYLRSQCVVDGALVRVPAFAKEVLLVLLLNRGRAFTREALTEMVWPDPDDQPEAAWHYVQRLVYELRRYGIPIETVTGNNRGWRIPQP